MVSGKDPAAVLANLDKLIVQFSAELITAPQGLDTPRGAAAAQVGSGDSTSPKGRLRSQTVAFSSRGPASSSPSSRLKSYKLTGTHDAASTRTRSVSTYARPAGTPLPRTENPKLSESRQASTIAKPHPPSLDTSHNRAEGRTLSRAGEGEGKGGADRGSGRGSANEGGGKGKESSPVAELDGLLDAIESFKLSSSSSPKQPEEASPLSPSTPALKSPPTSPTSSAPPPSTSPTSPTTSPKPTRRPTSAARRTQGPNTAASETCPYCNEIIGGYISIKALGRYWHADHLRCTMCEKVLGNATFYHKELDLYCGECWMDNFSPRCEFCKDPILETCIQALGRDWHPEHFFCSQCGKPIGNGEPFMEHSGKAYCEEDYFALFTPLCIKCERNITTEYVEALGRKWHPNCFVCTTCEKPLSNGTFYEMHGNSYCESHYHEAKGSICAGCNKPIAGRCLNVMGKKYHLDHFVCTFCMCQLGKTAFREGPGEKPYCTPCHTRLFG